MKVTTLPAPEAASNSCDYFDLDAPLNTASDVVAAQGALLTEPGV
jgi:hypothetical protein